jgi:hypothetical protein
MAPENIPTPALTQGAIAPDTVRKKKKSAISSTQRYLPIAEIREDTLLLKNGGIRAVIKVNSLNFNLKSESEQQGIIAGYQSFVNTLIFPLQIVIRSSRLNIDPYLSGLKDRAEKQQSPLLKEQTMDYADFMEKLVDVADIMQKNFYVVVPMDSGTLTKRGVFQRFLEWMNVDDTRSKAMQRSREFKSTSKVLRDRVTVVTSGLENIGITAHRLKSEELVQLFYSIYNPTTSQKQKFGGLGDLNTSKAALF